MEKYILDGNTACAKMANLFSEVCPIYPITPSSSMAYEIEKNAFENKNLFNNSVKVVQMQSEAGAAGTMHGALISGSLASTFTASQGLLLMIPNMYKIAGECLPGVIHVASRTVATHALSIFGDHSDIYATRQTGFCMLSSSNVKDAYYMAAVAHLSAIEGSLPFLHFFDGFRTSHEINTVSLVEEMEILKLIDFNKIDEFKKSSLNYKSDKQMGMAENEDIYFQLLESRNSLYNKMPDIVNEYMEKINKLANTSYKPFNYYGASDATEVVVAMGSVNDTIKQVIDEENKQGKKYGLIEVHLYRPFSKKYLTNVLPNTVRNIAVLDKTKEAGSIGEPLYLDVLASLNDLDIKIIGGRYGISSKNTTPAHIKSVFENLEEEQKNNFTIGIDDDVTNLSLKFKEYNLNLDAKEIKIYGFGSDGMISSSKSILKTIGQKEDKYVQGYFEYDSKKSGGITVSNLRISSNLINAPYYITHPEIVVVTKQEYFGKYDMLSNLKDNGILLVNVDNMDELLCKLAKEKSIEDKKITIYAVEASKIARENKLDGKINKIMEVILLKILGIENSTKIVSDNIKEMFKLKGEEVIDNNIKAINQTFENIKKIKINDYLTKEEISYNIYEKINRREGNFLKVSELIELKNGSFKCGLSKDEKRNVSSSVVKWKKQNCIGCGNCSFVCPHAVIRSFIVDDKDKGIDLAGKPNYNYYISISEADCTGCGLCLKACPGKNGEKALEFGKYDEEKQKESNYYFNEYDNPKVFDNKFTIKTSQLEKPRFEFSGACAGCGETSYIKLLTQLYQDKLVIANATGCSSIYGGSTPSTAYTIPWANSLFEDNAEFAYGMHISYKNERNIIEQVMKQSIDVVDDKVKVLYETWLNNKNDYEKTLNVYNEIKSLEIPNELKKLAEYIPARTVWAIGGDGWAYDIGFSGIDHILSSNENIKILVLDTEVYSNTGGQASKSSRIGQVAEFASMGKNNYKKDLFKIAMSYPNVYVANISLGANMMQTINAFKEAEEHKGPAIILAYSPCIEHGINGGLNCSLEQQKKAVESGYLTLMRYKDETLKIDSKEPDFDKYIEFLETENRYRELKEKNEKLFGELVNLNKEEVIKKYNYYKKIKDNQN